jgi:hypothetical protein
VTNCVLTVSSLADFLIFPCTLKKEAKRSSEMSVNTTSTWCHIPEDCFLRSHRRENLKSYTKDTAVFYCCLFCYAVFLLCVVLCVLFPNAVS